MCRVQHLITLRTMLPHQRTTNEEALLDIIRIRFKTIIQSSQLSHVTWAEYIHTTHGIAVHTFHWAAHLVARVFVGRHDQQVSFMYHFTLIKMITLRDRFHRR